MNYYPVIIPTLCRYEHLKRCVDSLAQNTHADKTELIISLDYPAKESHREGYEKILTYIDSIKGFKKVTCLKQDHNVGVWDNLILLFEAKPKILLIAACTNAFVITSSFIQDKLNNDLSFLSILEYNISCFLLSKCAPSKYTVLKLVWLERYDFNLSKSILFTGTNEYNVLPNDKNWDLLYLIVNDSGRLSLMVFSLYMSSSSIFHENLLYIILINREGSVALRAVFIMVSKLATK